MTINIHPTAVVDSRADLAQDIQIGPGCVVGPNVKIGSGCRLVAQCYVEGHTTLGANNTLYPGVCFGAPPQDKSFEPGTVSFIKVGQDNIFREGVTVHPGTKPDTSTIIGNDCFLMANSHVGHNSEVQDQVILANGSVLGGYVTLGEGCFISGLCAIHQFCRVGRFAMLSGLSGISKDLPPFMISDGRNGAVRGVNIVAMRRNNFSKSAISAIKKVYDIFFRRGLNTRNAIEQIQAQVERLPEVDEFIQFVQQSKRGTLSNDVSDRRA